jgi:PAS domain S-box-containing protein
MNKSKWDDLRRRAESILGTSPGRDPEPGEYDILRLIHELEVHQVELEIQGEELRQKNVELVEIGERYMQLYQRAPVGFVSLNVKGRVLEANQAALEMLELPKSKIKNRGFSNLVHSEDQLDFLEILGKVNRVPSEKARGELRFMKAGVAPFYVHVEINPLKNGMGEVQGWLVAFIDITRSKKAETELHEVCARLEDSQGQLKRLSARLLSAHEEERKRLAGELHDSIGQTLAAMKFSIENTLGNTKRGKAEEANSLLEQLVPVLQSAIDEVRNIYSGLRPAMLDDLGIISTLGWFCRQFMATFPNIHVELTIDIDEADMPDGLKICIFRIVQEALNNAAKHSSAEWVDLSLRGERGWVDLVVEDDGIGFDLEDLNSHPVNRPGVGLASMKERAELSGGALSVLSAHGTGTRIEVRWDTSRRQH